jgi:hypothetical protein
MPIAAALVQFFIYFYFQPSDNHTELANFIFPRSMCYSLKTTAGVTNALAMRHICSKFADKPIMLGQ